MLTLQRAEPKVDVALIDVSVAIKANKEELFTKLDAAKVPNLAEQPEWARIDGDRSVAFSRDNLAILYNTDAVKEPPISWTDLADPKYKGKIAAKLSDTRGVILLPILTKLEGWRLQDLRRSGHRFPANRLRRAFRLSNRLSCYAVVQSGEVDLSICWNGRAQYLR